MTSHVSKVNLHNLSEPEVYTQHSERNEPGRIGHHAWLTIGQVAVHFGGEDADEISTEIAALVKLSNVARELAAFYSDQLVDLQAAAAAEPGPAEQPAAADPGPGPEFLCSGCGTKVVGGEPPLCLGCRAASAGGVIPIAVHRLVLPLGPAGNSGPGARESAPPESAPTFPAAWPPAPGPAPEPTSSESLPDTSEMPERGRGLGWPPAGPGDAQRLAEHVDAAATGRTAHTPPYPPLRPVDGPA